jgi:hypothetical protein
MRIKTKSQTTTRKRPEPYRGTIASVLGDRPLPEVGGKMLRELIKLPDPDDSLLWVRISRRRGMTADA